MKIYSFICATLAISLFAIPGTVLAADASLSDARFLKNAAEAGNYEVEASKLALKKSQNPEVQKFAKHMIEDHTKAAEELKVLAQKKKVELPTEPSFMQKGSLMLLETHDGKKFDEEYAENVGVDAHKSTLELFEKAAKSADDNEIKQFANKVLPTLKHHEEAAKKLDQLVD